MNEEKRILLLSLRQHAEQIRMDVKTFLAEKLHLELSIFNSFQVGILDCFFRDLSHTPSYNVHIGVLFSEEGKGSFEVFIFI